MKTEITIPTQHLVGFLIQSFRYALPREFTYASIESSERIAEYWGIIPHSFKSQIKEEALNAIKVNQIKEDDTVAAWKKVLKLELNDSDMKIEITIPTRHLVDFLIQSFRYALTEERTGASTESAVRITEYWGIIPHSFRLQIKGDILNALQTKQIKEDHNLLSWKSVLKLEDEKGQPDQR